MPSFRNFRKKCETILAKYFFEDTVSEWVRDKVDEYIMLSEILDDKLRKIKVRLKLEL